ncbi:MAG: type I DNA topoisomerase [Alloprevotella sp.]|nr:type I DNA topoisomerase [Alloprevotella sp.]MDY6296741.1 type I DNA topoisomerase [Alloprevotella sp.]
MQKNLVIVESPAKAKTIEKFLGKDYKVVSSFGHIRDLKKKNFGVDLETFKPEYEIPEDKRRVVSELQSAASKAEKVWLASDEDREGEAISWHLAEVLGLDEKATNRIVFHEITKPAILSAIESPRTIDLNLVDAQQARRVLDRLVGFKLSPVLWRKVRPSLSAGRVQSVAVRLIVEREREVANFKTEMSYHVIGQFAVPTNDGTAALKAELRRTFRTKDEARAFLEGCRGGKFVIRTITTRPARRTPAPPFTTSTLQQEAARKLGLPVAQTMRVAQSLYEAGLITYMRTDSMNLSSLFLNACGPVIEELAGKEYHKLRRYHTNSKGAQEAHEAIRPTDIARSTISGTQQERRLYNLIWKRTVACQMADAELERTVAEIFVDGSDDPFVATGEVVKFDGFLRVYRESHDTEAENEEEGGLLPPMKEGQAIEAATITATQRFTQRPLRYTEASLVHKLEELGIGRPSTYAPTISTIQQREYVVKGDRPAEQRTVEELVLESNVLSESVRVENYGAEKNKLLPTDIGLVVNDFLLEHFPYIMDYNFTAKVEHDFDDVAEGKRNWTELIRAFYGHFEPEVERTMNEKNEHKVGERSLGTDPESGKAVFVKIGRFGPMAQLGEPGERIRPRFAPLKPGQSIETISLEEALELFRLPRVLGRFEGLNISVNAGRFGPYVVHKKMFASLPKDMDPMEITFEEGVKLIVAKRKEEAQKHIKAFEQEPDLEIRSGRFGPYLSYKGKNYKLTKDVAQRAAELTLEECLEYIKKEDARPPKRQRGQLK